MRVLMLVQQMDERDWLRAFIVAWVRALAAHVDQLDVITLEAGAYTVPANVSVTSLGKETGKDRLREARRFHAAMLRLAPRCDVIFSHMTPRYTVFAAPYAARFRKRQVLWFTHRQMSRPLALALRLAWRITTAAPDSFPVASPKVRALGHGIDTTFYAPDPHPSAAADTPPAIVHVARLMPIKHQATLIRALAHVPDAAAVLIGDVPAGQEHYRDYAAQLRALAHALNVHQRVIFRGGLLADAVRAEYRSAAVAVNLSPVGLFDKAALESMAAGVPTLVANPAFDSLLPDVDLLRLPAPDAVDVLGDRLRRLLALPDADRAALGTAQRDRVVAAHSLDRLMPRLAAVLATGEIPEAHA